MSRRALSESFVASLKTKFEKANVKVDQAFAAFDENDDGSISRTEFRKGLYQLNMNLTEREIEDLIRHFDADNDGQISATEFARVFGYSSKRAAVGGQRANPGAGGSWRLSDDAIRTMQRKFKDAGVNLKQAFLAF
eukprot:SAG31_NODE_20358_length_576_cov_28.090147_1_plen_135_part_10